MIIRQLFDEESYTYTYLVADKASRQAALIDPVIGHVERYLQLIKELGLKLALALDTHVHADHITALGTLREQTGCTTYLGNATDDNSSTVSCADHAFKDQQIISLGQIVIKVIYTPGHTDNSYSFLVQHPDQDYLFTGDTLLIRGTGRTDFQNGDATQLYHSLHDKLLQLDGATVVYPGHDYKGWTLSTIAEEKAHNPRLQIKDINAFVEHMGNLNLPNPKFMDVAVPANLSCGKPQLDNNK